MRVRTMVALSLSLTAVVGCSSAPTVTTTDGGGREAGAHSSTDNGGHDAPAGDAGAMHDAAKNDVEVAAEAGALGPFACPVSSPACATCTEGTADCSISLDDTFGVPCTGVAGKACATAYVVGQCAYDAGVTFYYAYPAFAGSVEADVQGCIPSGGTWTTAPAAAMCAPCLGDPDCGPGGVCVAQVAGASSGFCATACSGSSCAASGATCSDVTESGTKHCYPASGACSTSLVASDSGLPAPGTFVVGRALHTCPPVATAFLDGTNEISCYDTANDELYVFYDGVDAGAPPAGSYSLVDSGLTYDPVSDAGSVEYAPTAGTYTLVYADGGLSALTFRGATFSSGGGTVTLSANIVCPPLSP